MKISELAMKAIANAYKQPGHGSIKSREVLPNGYTKTTLAFCADEDGNIIDGGDVDQHMDQLLQAIDEADQIYKEQSDE